MEEQIKEILPYLNEKQKRLFLASCTNTIGWGGIKKVCEISGCSKPIVIRGKKELKTLDSNDERVRKTGGGRKKAEEIYPDLQAWIERIVAESGLNKNPAKRDF